MTPMHTYAVDLVWDQARKGTLTAPGLTHPIEVATPPEFDGGMPGIWSPEHLYVAAISSCLMTTFLAIAAYSHLPFVSFTCPAEGTLAKGEGKLRMTHVRLRPRVVVPPGTDLVKAHRILEKAEAACLITQSVSAEVTLEAEVVEAPQGPA